MVQAKQNWARSLTMAMNLATSVAAVIAVGLFAGKWLDGKLHTGYILTIVGFLLGAASAGKMLWERLMEDSIDIKKKKFQ
jgi:F0F1-type ATP synthase assembly protein I